MAHAAAAGVTEAAAEHGFILRAGFEALAALAALEASGKKAVLHGSMVEITILSFSDQTATDLLNGKAPCYVDDKHHLQGAKQLPLRTAADVVALAAAVEQRLVRGTKMNDTSSRSHCVACFKLSVAEGGAVRDSRLQFFDLMGSERFVGANAAHDTGSSSKSTQSGWEGIYANLSLSALMTAVEMAAAARTSKKKAGAVDSAMVGFLLTKLLMGSLTGRALTGIITCISQAARNGDETFNSLKFGGGMAKLLNAPAPQPTAPLDGALAKATKALAASRAVVAKGVVGKWAARRAAEVTQFEHEVEVLQALAS